MLLAVLLLQPVSLMFNQLAYVDCVNLCISMLVRCVWLVLTERRPRKKLSLSFNYRAAAVPLFSLPRNIVRCYIHVSTFIQKLCSNTVTAGLALMHFAYRWWTDCPKAYAWFLLRCAREIQECCSKSTTLLSSILQIYFTKARNASLYQQLVQ